MSNRHIGSNFDDILNNDGNLAEVEAAAIKKVLSWQILQAIQLQELTKSEMAKKMNTSRHSLDRLLDESNTSVTLRTLSKAAAVLGKTIKFEITDRPM